MNILYHQLQPVTLLVIAIILAIFETVICIRTLKTAVTLVLYCTMDVLELLQDYMNGRSTDEQADFCTSTFMMCFAFTVHG